MSYYNNNLNYFHPSPNKSIYVLLENNSNNRVSTLSGKREVKEIMFKNFNKY